jgi:hypothetical protein
MVAQQRPDRSVLVGFTGEAMEAKHLVEMIVA